MDDHDFEDLMALEEIAVAKKKLKRLDPVTYYSDLEFHQRFHLPKDVVRHLCNLLHPQLERMLNMERRL